MSIHYVLIPELSHTGTRPHESLEDLDPFACPAQLLQEPLTSSFLESDAEWWSGSTVNDNHTFVCDINTSHNNIKSKITEEKEAKKDAVLTESVSLVSCWSSSEEEETFGQVEEESVVRKGAVRSELESASFIGDKSTKGEGEAAELEQKTGVRGGGRGGRGGEGHGREDERRDHDTGSAAVPNSLAPSVPLFNPANRQQQQQQHQHELPFHQQSVTATSAAAAATTTTTTNTNLNTFPLFSPPLFSPSLFDHGSLGSLLGDFVGGSAVGGIGHHDTGGAGGRSEDDGLGLDDVNLSLTEFFESACFDPSSLSGHGAVGAAAGTPGLSVRAALLSASWSSPSRGTIASSLAGAAAARTATTAEPAPTGSILGSDIAFALPLASPIFSATTLDDASHPSHNASFHVFVNPASATFDAGIPTNSGPPANLLPTTRISPGPPAAAAAASAVTATTTSKAAAKAKHLGLPLLRLPTTVPATSSTLHVPPPPPPSKLQHQPPSSSTAAAHQPVRPTLPPLHLPALSHALHPPVPCSSASSSPPHQQQSPASSARHGQALSSSTHGATGVGAGSTSSLPWQDLLTRHRDALRLKLTDFRRYLREHDAVIPKADQEKLKKERRRLLNRGYQKKARIQKRDALTVFRERTAQQMVRERTRLCDLVRGFFAPHVDAATLAGFFVALEEAEEVNRKERRAGSEEGEDGEEGEEGEEEEEGEEDMEMDFEDGGEEEGWEGREEGGEEKKDVVSKKGKRSAQEAFGAAVKEEKEGEEGEGRAGKTKKKRGDGGKQASVSPSLASVSATGARSSTTRKAGR